MVSTRTVWGQRICAGRRAAGLTQIQFAAALGVTQQLVSAWERGIAAPGINRRARIARILAIPADELFSYDPPEANGDDEAAA